MILRYSILALAITTVVGCTNINSEQYHQETLQAISQSEDNISQKIGSIEERLDNQDSYINSLEQDIFQLQSRLENFEQETAKKLSNIHRLNAAKQSVEQDVLKKEENPAIAPVVLPYTQTGEAVLGELETINIQHVDNALIARIDTGASTSSLNAKNIEFFERNGADWVRFDLVDTSDQIKVIKTLEEPIVRMANVKQANSKDVTKRPIVELWVKVGDIREKSEFSLADRSHMNHPVLLGREFIRDIAIVDVSKQFVFSQEDTQQTVR
ncbi:ATP-dependent zinc protease [Vibrio sp.]|nr:ATP-dependent zinc protease [Vibrio sp.]